MTDSPRVTLRVIDGVADVRLSRPDKLSAVDGDMIDAIIDTQAAIAAARPQLIGWGWYELPQPVIAALHGPVYGAGLHIALGADIRIVTPDATLAFVETDWGLVPDLSPMQSLRRVARLDVIKDWSSPAARSPGKKRYRWGWPRAASTTPSTRP